MKNNFLAARWIWISQSAGVDEYGSFLHRFSAGRGAARLRISCDGDYTLMLNGRYVASNQYGDYEHYKIFDELEVGEYLHEGENELSVLVWHFGEDSQRYVNAKAGVIFELEQEGRLLLASGRETLCRKDPCYRSGYAKQITSQMGFGFLYDATKEGLGEYAPAVLVEKRCDFYPRPIPKLTLREPKAATVLVDGGTRFLVDLGEETVGIPVLELFSDREQAITVAWGEDLQNGHVRQKIGNRDFSFEYIAKQGENSYTNYMLRLGCRYLELHAEHPVTLHYLGVREQLFPVCEKPVQPEDPTDQRIWELCVRTLRLSMMEHYVDTPWREQCLYVFDSRNQMLCGYKVFCDQNRDYARANLLLISQDRRADGLLSICYPCGRDYAIPSFSLYYFMAVREYLDATGDLSLVAQVYPRLERILQAFLDNRRNGLVHRFGGNNRWNFYDWAEHMQGKRRPDDADTPDLMINCLFVLALEHFRELSRCIELPFAYEQILMETKRQTHVAFFDAEQGVYALTRGGKDFTALGNALAVLSGIAQNADALCERIARGELSDCSLSMKCFLYDALLQTDAARWQEWVHGDIRKNYTPMLLAGATSVWETVQGASDFGNAGSLCHGWSAIPVCYLTPLDKATSEPLGNLID